MIDYWLNPLVMTLFTFRAFQILGENLLCFAVWCLRSLKVIKCSALHDISVLQDWSFTFVKPDCWLPSAAAMESHRVPAVVLWTSSWGQQTLSEPSPLQSRSCSMAECSEKAKPHGLGQAQSCCIPSTSDGVKG